MTDISSVATLPVTDNTSTILSNPSLNEPTTIKNSALSTPPLFEDPITVSTPSAPNIALLPSQNTTTLSNFQKNISSFSGAEIGLWICILIAVVVLIVSSSITSNQYWSKDNLLMSVFIAIVAIALFNSWTLALLSSKIPWYISYIIIILSFYFLVVAIIIGYKTQNNPENKKDEDTTFNNNVATMAVLITALALLLFNRRINEFVMLFIRYKTPGIEKIGEAGVNFILLCLFFTSVAGLLALDNKYLRPML